MRGFTGLNVLSNLFVLRLRDLAFALLGSHFSEPFALAAFDS